MRKFIHNLSVLLVLLVSGCHFSNKPLGNTETLSGLKEIAYTPKPDPHKAKAASTSRIREMGLRETALSLGAQSGLAWRARTVDEQLVKQTRYLDAIYDFNSLILEHNVLPPVLLEGRQTLNLADAQTIRISDRTYKVSKQARFITTPPHWRQYLWLDYKQPEYPHLSLLPKNDAERQVWCSSVEKGWRDGVNQANTILEENIARLKEDFTGMILYRKLLSMNMISPPYVSHTDLGVTGDADEIHVDDRVLRITALPGLNVNSQEWRAAVSKDEQLLSQFNQMEKRILESKITISNNTWQPTITPVN